MCLAVPARVVELVDENDQIAKVEISGVRRNISVALLEDVKVGDWVLVHVGFAIQKIDENEAEQTLMLLRQLGQIDEEFFEPEGNNNVEGNFVPT